jgi:hypothetical protein
LTSVVDSNKLAALQPLHSQAVTFLSTVITHHEYYAKEVNL